eukprot:TRINITY_DN57962_c0_g1_i1.p1 TRINITY_DN57962_c0_g1~~TRINITY_DN57962_c0_g1_i1.p1  ORF type:complete len:684 (+),score=249.41 TRINITY_DN57962_c0_g1_i1:407-2458(+)
MTAIFGGAARYHSGEAVPHRSGEYDWGADDDSESNEEAAGTTKKKGVTFGVAEDTEGDIRDALSVVGSDSEESDTDLPLKERVYLLFTDPTSSRWALRVSLFFFVLILLSTLAFILESVPSLSSDPEYGNPDNEQFWKILEAVFVGFFTVEYVVSFVTSPDPKTFPLQIYSIIDLLAIMPFYIEICVEAAASGETVDLRFIRVVRLARVFRILKMGKQYDGADILYQVISTAFPALAPPFFFLFLGIVVFSSMIYICEQGTYDKYAKKFYVSDAHGNLQESSFISIPESLWWCLVTMTTVGYGDSYPKTVLGKTVGACAMMFGVMFSAMPIAIIGSTFTVKWDEMKLRMNATKDFRSNDQINNTNNWGPNQLKFFGIEFNEKSESSVHDFIMGPTPTTEAENAMRVLEYHEQPSRYISRRLSHELLTNRDRIEKGVLPKSQWNLAFKLYHIMRAESSKCENNIETYTLDFLTELYHVLGFGKWDQATGVHLGFRSKAGLTVSFGEGAHEKIIKSDSDLGVFSLLPGKSYAVYFMGNECKTTSAPENYGRIAGELLATAQSFYRLTGRQELKTVFLVTCSGYHLRFYAAEFPPTYLDAIGKGKKPDTCVTIRHYPPKMSMAFHKSTIMGTFDFLTPAHREEAVELFVRIRRMIIDASACPSQITRRQSIQSLRFNDLRYPSPAL